MRAGESLLSRFLSMKKTIVYIDGFNLYYRLKKTPYKWLNLYRLAYYYLDPKKHQISKIKYFTARVKEYSENSSNTNRQNVYLRAIRSINNLEIIFGQFKNRTVKGKYCYHCKKQKFLTKCMVFFIKLIEGHNVVTVKKFEEKESDVNIATHIVADAYENNYDCAVLISNDTDLKTPLRYVKKRLKKEIGIISPRRNIHSELMKISNFQKRISNKILKECQFPEKMNDHKGEFFCPSKWR